MLLIADRVTHTQQLKYSLKKICMSDIKKIWLQQFIFSVIKQPTFVIKIKSVWSKSVGYFYSVRISLSRKTDKSDSLKKWNIGKPL